nr:hypothetical protein [Tanacetum cinerariifolium]
MDMTIDQQVELDEALIPHASRLRIGKSNFRLRLDITSKESTLQLVYDVLRLTPFYKAFLVIADTFDELPFEEEILAFLRYLGHSKEIKKITDVNINKLHQPWRSFAAVINKYLSGKSTGYDSLRLSQAQILWACTIRRMWTLLTFGAMLLVELTNEDIRNSATYKEYYDIASEKAPPKMKASVRKTQSSSDTTMPPPMAAGTRLSTSAKGKQPAKLSKAKGLSVLSEVTLTEAEQIKLDTQRSLQQTHISQASRSGTDEETESDNESNDDECHGMNVGGDEGPDAEDDDEELYRDVNINMEGRDVQMTDVHTTQVLKDTHVTLTLVNPDGQQQSSSMSSQFVTSMFNPSPDAVTAPSLPPPFIPIMSQVQQAPTPTPTTAPSSFLQDLLNFGSLFRVDHRLKTLEANFSEFKQTNQFAKSVSSILRIVDRYINHQINEAVKVAIIKKQVKEQVKVQVSKILPNIKKTVNEQLEAKVLTRSSNSSKTSYDMAADISELELKKILIEKMESNKSIHRSDEQRNLYKALVDAYKCDKIILDTYGDTVTLKRRRDDVNKDEEPSAGSDRGSKRRKRARVNKCSKGKDLQDHCSMDLRSTGSLLEIDDDKLYKFKEGDFKRLRIQDIEDMLLLLVQGKVTNLIVKERFAFNVSFRIFTRSIVIQWRVEDLQLGVESYQKKLNLIKPDTYRTDLKRKEAYTAYSNPRGFIYQNKDKQNRLMRIDELHKFSDDTLNDVRTALDDRLKGIQIKYLPHTIWRRSEKERAAAMIQAIDKQLKTRRIMRSLEKFVGGRLSILTDSQVTPTKHERMTKPYSSPRFIANYFNAGYLKMEVKHAVATALAQNDNGSLEADNIVRAASTRAWSVLFKNSVPLSVRTKKSPNVS